MSKCLMISSLAVLAALTVVVPPARAQEQGTADWYLARPDIAREKERWCSDHPTEQENQVSHGDFNCTNAREALTRILLRQQDDDE
jgi:hypothetical protein